MADGHGPFTAITAGDHGVTLLRSPALDLPGVVHGFATRAGGVSQGTWAGADHRGGR